MKLKNRTNPTTYFSETTQYVKDLEQVTALRDKCANPKERLEYDNVIFCMQRVLLFMNTLSKKDEEKLPTPAE